MRLLCLLLSHFPWSCEAVRTPRLTGRPAIVIREAGSRKTVLDCSPGLDDIQPGSDLSPALARHDASEIVPADEPYYRQSFELILDALEQVSPLVEGSEPGLAYVGLRGLELLYKTNEELIKAVQQVIPSGFLTHIGIAQNKFLACLAARRSPPGGYYVLDGDVTAFLRDLPGDVLPIAARSKKKLRDFGIRTLGELAALAPGPVLSQFGPEGKCLWRLAHGEDDTPLYPRSLNNVIEEATSLGSVTTSLEAIMTTIESLLNKAFIRISPAGLGISRLVVWTRGENAACWEKAVNFKEPAMDVRSALRRVRSFLESFPQPGPVEQVGIRLARLGYGVGRQKSIFSEVRAKDHLIEDIKQLGLRLDAPQVFQVREVEPWSRIPERRYALAPLNR